MITFDKKTFYMIGVVVFVVLSGVIYLSFFDGVGAQPSTVMITLPLLEDEIVPEVLPVSVETLAQPPPTHEIETPGATNSDHVVVFVSGEVHEPGVFELPHGSRKVDAVALAGGVTEQADLNRINLAMLLADTQHVIVPAFGQVLAESTQAVTPGTVAEPTGLVNINTADTATLQTLPGIGPVLSQNIVNHRQIHGDFATVEELINVPQIGAATLANVKALVTTQ